MSTIISSVVIDFVFYIGTYNRIYAHIKNGFKLGFCQHSYMIANVVAGINTARFYEITVTVVYTVAGGGIKYL